jgi:hypothetical protein
MMVVCLLMIDSTGALQFSLYPLLSLGSEVMVRRYSDFWLVLCVYDGCMFAYD